MDGNLSEGSPPGQSSFGAPWRYMPMYALSPHLGNPGGPAGTDATVMADLTAALAAENQTFLPPNMPADPRVWSHKQVCLWLDWCVQHFSLPPIDLDNFHMNGRALCLLTKSDFKDRFPRAGDVIFNCLHILVLRATPAPNVSNLMLGQAATTSDRSHNGGGVSLQRLWPRSVSSDFQNIGYIMQEQSTGGEMDSTVILSPAPSTEGASDKSGLEGKGPAEGIHQIGSASEEEEEQQNHHHHQQQQPQQQVAQPVMNGHKEVPCYQASLANIHQQQQHNAVAQLDYPQEKSVRLLWDFLQQLLNDPNQRYKRCIAWKEKMKGVFKIVDPHQLAYLWGMQKNHLNMNFDKMSRALRYYYRVKILQKEPGERHCYRFLRHPTELRNCKQRSLLSNKGGLVSPTAVMESEGVLNMSVKDEWSPDAESE